MLQIRHELQLIKNIRHVSYGIFYNLENITQQHLRESADKHATLITLISAVQLFEVTEPLLLRTESQCTFDTHLPKN